MDEVQRLGIESFIMLAVLLRGKGEKGFTASLRHLVICVDSVFNVCLSVPRAVSYDLYAEQVDSGPPSNSIMLRKEYSHCNKDWTSVERYAKQPPKR